jgi:lipopolysaccharide/colanic/teichoic acid biosynthesis glycosyltransferase
MFDSAKEVEYECGSSMTYDFSKRLLDFVAASVALLIFAPLFVVLAVLIAAVDGAPVFFRHERVGRHGAVFSCLKFRTMKRDAESVLARHLAANEDARREWIETVKLRNDPRILPIVGELLRTTSLDELPQLINVLRGEMSLVGPRPVPAGELGRYGNAVPAYLSVRPGLTGLWQVSGRNNTTYTTRIALDQEYVRSRSLFLDLRILIRTPLVVLTRHGAA